MSTLPRLIELSLPELKVLLTTYKVKPGAGSRLEAAMKIDDASLPPAKASLQKRGLVESAAMKPSPDLVSIKGALEVLAKPTRELTMVRIRATQPTPSTLSFVVSAQQSCLFFDAGDRIKLGPATLNAQLFSLFSRDLKGGSDDDFKPLVMLPLHYQLLLALQRSGLSKSRKGFSKAALDAVLTEIKLEARAGAAIVASAVQAQVLTAEADGFTLTASSRALLERMKSGEITEVVARETVGARAPESILYAGAPGYRVACDRLPASRKEKRPALLTFLPVTANSLNASLGKWLGVTA